MNQLARYWMMGIFILLSPGMSSLHSRNHHYSGDPSPQLEKHHKNKLQYYNSYSEKYVDCNVGLQPMATWALHQFLATVT